MAQMVGTEHLSEDVPPPLPLKAMHQQQEHQQQEDGSNRQHGGHEAVAQVDDEYLSIDGAGNRTNSSAAHVVDVCHGQLDQADIDDEYLAIGGIANDTSAPAAQQHEVVFFSAPNSSSPTGVHTYALASATGHDAYCESAQRPAPSVATNTRKRDSHAAHNAPPVVAAEKTRASKSTFERTGSGTYGFEEDTALPHSVGVKEKRGRKVERTSSGTHGFSAHSEECVQVEGHKRKFERTGSGKYGFGVHLDESALPDLDVANERRERKFERTGSGTYGFGAHQEESALPNVAEDRCEWRPQNRGSGKHGWGAHQEQGSPPHTAAQGRHTHGWGAQPHQQQLPSDARGMHSFEVNADDAAAADLAPVSWQVSEDGCSVRRRSIKRINPAFSLANNTDLLAVPDRGGGNLQSQAPWSPM